MCGPGQDSDNFWLNKPFGLDIAVLDIGTILRKINQETKV